MKKTLALIIPLLVAANSSVASISITDSTLHLENFDSLASTGSGVAWVNDSTLAGWSLFRQPAPGTAITTYTTGAGAATTGSFYSFGSASSTERAFGGVASGGAYFGSPASATVAGWIAVSLVNNSGSAIDSVSIQYDGEQWRDGGNATPVSQTMVLEWGIGSLFTAVGSWTAAGSGFNFTSPVYTATAAAVDGNVAGKVAGIGGTISSMTWNNGDTLWIRWIENNDAGNDHGLALDNFQFAAVVPEPSALTLVGLGVVGLLVSRRRR